MLKPEMSDAEHIWALVLAAGEGRRLSSFTTTSSGLTIPKQFCSLDQGPSLLQDALERASSVTARERICAIVAVQHRLWWLEQLDGLPRENICVQQQNRGTANGILLPLLSILERDSEARVLILPSDHYVRDEQQLARSLRYAVARSDVDWAEILLLGIEPLGPDTELGYIVPRCGTTRLHQEVERFVEKPDAVQAQALLEQGALWNSFIIAADGQSLLRLYERRWPDVVVAMRDALSMPGSDDSGKAVAEIYQALPELDFSRSILQGQEQYVRVLRVPECGWSDLGTPQRVSHALHALPRIGRRPEQRVAGRTLLSLAAQHRRLGPLARMQT